MKQQITVEQLNELTNEQKEKLQEWWKPNSGDKYYYPKVDSTGYIHSSLVLELEHFKDGDHYPLLSIGQMIDILHARNSSFGDHYIDFDWERELVDALWNEIKAVL